MSNEDFKNMIFEYLASNLYLDVTTDSVYVGSLGEGESLYKDYHTIKIILEDKVITSAYLG